MNTLGLKVSENVASLVPYPPGKPIEELERELGITGSIKLASNENPLGPSRKAIKAVADALTNLHRYPDGSCYYLKERLSERLGVPGDSLIFGNGSNEIIELLVRAFIREGDEVVMADPSFAVYPIAVKSVGAKSVLVPLKDMRHDLVAMAKAITPKTKVVFIANPNNPTGTIVSSDELEGFMRDLPAGVIVCIDEAYCEFVSNPEYPDSLRYLSGDKPVLILRTFSKIYGLAGVRVGYGMAQSELIDLLGRVRQPFNVNALAQVAALGALEDTEHTEATRRNNAEGLKYLYGEMARLGFEYVPTEANFFLIKVGDGRAVYEGLLRKGVIVRPMASYGLGGYIRVSVGLPQENRRFVEAFAQVVSSGR